jgi:DNA-binding transcriptional regulator YiaG
MRNRAARRNARFAKAIEKVRAGRLQGQREFAETLGKTMKTIQGWEAGEHAPSWPTLRSLKTILTEEEWALVEEALSE